MDIEQAIQSHRVLTQSLADAVGDAGAVGLFELEPDYVEARDPCDSDLSFWQAWTPSLQATAVDPEGEGFWPTTWDAVRGVAERAGFEEHVVLEDNPGNHAVEFSNGAGALILVMAKPTTEDPSITRTSIKLRTGCHPDGSAGSSGEMSPR